MREWDGGEKGNIGRRQGEGENVETGKGGKGENVEEKGENVEKKDEKGRYLKPGEGEG